MRVKVALAQNGKVVAVVAAFMHIDTSVERDMKGIGANLCQSLNGYVVFILVIALHAEIVGMVSTEI